MRRVRTAQRLRIVLSLAAALLFAGSAFATATILDFTNPYNTSEHGIINSAVYIESGLQPAGSGVIDSFVRINPGGNQPFEQGYNTDYRPLQYDENNSGTFTRDLPLTSVPIVTCGAGLSTTSGCTTGVSYREFLLDINERDNAADKLLSLRRVIVFLRSNGDLDDATATEGLPFGATGSALFPALSSSLVYDSGLGNQVWLNYSEDSGSGQADMLLYIPDSFFTGSNPWVYLYSEFGGFSGPTPGGGYSSVTCAGTPPPYATTNAVTGNQRADNDLCADDGYEEWAVHGTLPPVIPEPASLLLFGTLLAGVGTFLRLRRR